MNYPVNTATLIEEGKMSMLSVLHIFLSCSLTVCQDCTGSLYHRQNSFLLLKFKQTDIENNDTM